MFTSYKKNNAAEGREEDFSIIYNYAMKLFVHFILISVVLLFQWISLEHIHVGEEEHHKNDCFICLVDQAPGIDISETIQKVVTIAIFFVEITIPKSLDIYQLFNTFHKLGRAPPF